MCFIGIFLVFGHMNGNLKNPPKGITSIIMEGIGKACFIFREIENRDFLTANAVPFHKIFMHNYYLGILFSVFTFFFKIRKNHHCSWLCVECRILSCLTDEVEVRDFGIFCSNFLVTYWWLLFRILRPKNHTTLKHYVHSSTPTEIGAQFGIFSDRGGWH